MTNPQTILDLLIAAGHVSQETVDQAASIASFFKDKPVPTSKSLPVSEPEDHKLTFPEILQPYLRVATNRTCYEARKNGVSMRHIAKVLDITHQAVSHACNAYRKKHSLKKYPRWNGSDKEFKMYYEINLGLACYELRKQGLAYREIKKLTGHTNTPLSSAHQYAKNYNQPWPITFAG